MSPVFISYMYSILYRLSTNSVHCNGDVREQPKVIVFLNQLLELFTHCHLCFAKKPSVTTRQTGTMVSVTSTCAACNQQFIWNSQPMIFGHYYAGNVLLSFTMLCAGSCIRKTLRVFQHMNICAFSEGTFYHHQKNLLIPARVKFWWSYQDKMFKSLSNKDVVFAGDGRHYSMGHSAKLEHTPYFVARLD